MSKPGKSDHVNKMLYQKMNIFWKKMFFFCIKLKAILDTQAQWLRSFIHLILASEESRKFLSSLLSAVYMFDIYIKIES